MARETPGILPMSKTLIPLPLSSLAGAAAASSILRGLPPWRLFAAAAARPALVRSIIVSRSSCANAAMTVNMAVPMGPVVSSPSVRDRNPAPPSLVLSMMSRTWRVLRLATRNGPSALVHP